MKRQFAYSFILALVWCLFYDDFSVNTFISGLILSWLILIFLRRSYFEPVYPQRMLYLLRFFLIFLKEVVKANLAVIRMIYKINLKATLKPGILEYPMTVQSDAMITALANAITLTPGTLSIDISPDRRFLYIHFLHIADPEEAKASIRTSLENPMLKLVSGKPTEVL